LIDPLPTPLPRLQLRAGLQPIGISPDDLNHFGVLANGGHAYFTNDGGATWKKKLIVNAFPVPIPAPPAAPPIIDPGATPIVLPGWPGFNATLAYADNQTLYIGNEAPVGTPQRVIKSTDGGESWAHKSTGLPPVPINKLTVSSADPSGQTVYAATWIGVYETTNGGDSWHLFGQDLPVVNVTDLYMPPDGSYLRASTYGRGVWEIRLSGATSTQ
jgi:photosystem II stability/assembly factor-like uncharacterized protein